MTTETVVAIYDTPAHAELAIADLQAAGIHASSIQHYTRDEYAHQTHDTAQSHTGEKSEGLWAWFFGENDGAAHRGAYDHSLTSGSTVVTVVAEQTHMERIVSILEEHAPIDIEERASQAATYASSAATGAAAGTATASASSHAVTGAGTAGREEVISLAEENIQVGKREVDRGATRVRRYVVERPVEEQIRLRDERVSVFRRPVTNAAVGAEAFTDKVVEMRETDEEAVVSKTARVVEEVVVQKDVQERTETIRESLRREEVEITGPEGNVSDAGAHSRVA